MPKCFTPILVYITNQDPERFRILHPNKTLLYLPHWDTLPYENKHPSKEITGTRAHTVRALQTLKNFDDVILVATAKGFMQKIAEIADMFSPLSLKQGDEIDRQMLIEYLVNSGYESSSIVQQKGDFAVRGSVIDMFSPIYDFPTRFDFFGDALESIRTFDTLSQKTIKMHTDAELHPVFEFMPNAHLLRQNFREHFGIGDLLLEKIEKRFSGFEYYFPLFVSKTHNITDFLPQNATYSIEVDLIEEYEKIQLYHEKYQKIRPVLEPEALFWSKEEIRSFKPKTKLHEDIKPFMTKIETIDDFTKYARSETRPILICASKKGIHDRLLELIPNIKTSEVQEKGIYLTISKIKESYVTPSLVVLSEKDVVGKHYFKIQKKVKIAENDFQEGDYVVHDQHGIGQFLGLECVEVDNIKHDCVKLEYADQNKLFVPIEYFDSISRYSGSDVVALDKLGSLGFQKRKAKIKDRINDLAKKLMEIAVSRALIEADIFVPNSDRYEAFKKTFPYVESEDQEKAIDDVLDDLSAGKLMDRVICGDPGFGKTEVALRAAFAVIDCKKQVVILTPTRTLCNQHYKTCLERFKQYKVVQLTAGSKNAAELEKANLIIGTHALLSNKVEFKKIGLLIIDEEHHFGVAQKEKIKEKYKNIHILSLSATPIPRTLQLSLSGIKEMSLIASPPYNRRAIETIVGPFDDIRAKDVIDLEMQRGGQVFWVCPRIKDIDGILKRIKSINASLRVCSVHGQLPTNEIEHLMNQFINGGFDIMVATTIIEAGVDIPQANMMIIESANMFGLAQLYQLRGRVGRSNVQGYVYLTYDPEMKLSIQAKKRLEVMSNIDRLGIGFSIATHDMDIRGYGNVVGPEQSGHMSEVGMELYHEMFEEAMNELRTGEHIEHWTPQIKLNVSVLIPDSYIPDNALRIEIYRELSELKTKHDIDNYKMQIVDRFGEMPAEVLHLFDTIELKNMCLKLGIEKIDEGPKGIVVQFRNIDAFSDKMSVFMNTPWAKKYVNVTATKGICFNIPSNERIKVVKGFCQHLA